MKKIFKLIGTLLALSCVIYTFYSLWLQSQPEIKVYQLTQPEVRDIKTSIIASGYLEPLTYIELKPQVTGVVSQLKVELGDYVKKGQTVAVISVIPDMDMLNEAQRRVSLARMEYEQTERDASRMEELYEVGAISREEIEHCRKALAQAHQEVTSAENQVQIILKGHSVGATNVNTTVVTSQLSGYVLQLPVMEGAAVSGSSIFSEGTTIAKIGNLDNLIYKGTVDELQVDKLTKGLTIDYHIGAIKDETFRGQLEFIAPEAIIVNGTRQFEVKGSVAMPEGRSFRSGYSVIAQINLSYAQQVMAIAEGCVHYDEHQPFVYQLTSDPADSLHQTFEPVAVELGASDGLYVEIKSGLNPGMLIRK